MNHRVIAAVCLALGCKTPGRDHAADLMGVIEKYRDAMCACPDAACIEEAAQIVKPHLGQLDGSGLTDEQRRIASAMLDVAQRCADRTLGR